MPGGHFETIKCPKCGKVQEAIVKHTEPWWDRTHECDCGYWIQESEWERVSTSDRENIMSETYADTFGKMLDKLTEIPYAVCKKCGDEVQESDMRGSICSQCSIEQISRIEEI